MIEELKPCPFCGGEAHLVDDYSSEHDHTFYQVWHDCTTSPGAIRHAYGHALSLQISTPWCANEKDAVLLWNRRAERTCRMVDCSTHDTCVVNRELSNGDVMSMEFVYSPMPDVKALKGLADEMQGHADAADYDGDGRINAGCLWSYADRIREALGVES